MNDRYDVVVIGGGAAGLNGALMLARSRRSVLVIDAGEPRNAPAHGVHGLLGREGMPPGELLERGRAEVRSYGGRVESGSVVAAGGAAGDFTVSLADGRWVRARRLLVTTGVTDELPAVPGLVPRWGRDVLHCPYCHGWEARDQAIGVLATGPMSTHQAQMFRQLSADVVFFTHESELAPEVRDELAARDIQVVAGPVAGVETVDDRLAGVRLADGRLVPRQVLVVASRFAPRAGFLGALGLPLVDHPSGIGQHVPVDPTGRTPVPGVWAAGNVSDPFTQVGASAAAGALAGAHINGDLVTEDVRTAVAAVRATAPVPA